MFCSGCGQALAEGQAFCQQCGKPVAPPVPPVPGFQFQLENYAGKVKTLSILWFVYAGLSLLMGIAGATFARDFMMGGLGHWMHGPVPPFLMGPFFIHLIWLAVAVRVGLALVAAWGLWEHTQWGRIVAIVVGILSLLRFPLGTLLGVWTLVLMLGYRNSSLYEQL